MLKKILPTPDRDWAFTITSPNEFETLLKSIRNDTGIQTRLQNSHFVTFVQTLPTTRLRQLAGAIRDNLLTQMKTGNGTKAAVLSEILEYHKQNEQDLPEDLLKFLVTSANTQTDAPAMLKIQFFNALIPHLGKSPDPNLIDSMARQIIEDLPHILTADYRDYFAFLQDRLSEFKENSSKVPFLARTIFQVLLQQSEYKFNALLTATSIGLRDLKKIPATYATSAYLAADHTCTKTPHLKRLAKEGYVTKCALAKLLPEFIVSNIETSPDKINAVFQEIKSAYSDSTTEATRHPNRENYLPIAVEAEKPLKGNEFSNIDTVWQHFDELFLNRNKNTYTAIPTVLLRSLLQFLLLYLIKREKMNHPVYNAARQQYRSKLGSESEILNALITQELHSLAFRFIDTTPSSKTVYTPPNQTRFHLIHTLAASPTFTSYNPDAIQGLIENAELDKTEAKSLKRLAKNKFKEAGKYPQYIKLKESANTRLKELKKTKQN